MVSGTPKAAANWITRDLLKELNERDAELDEVAVTPPIMGSLIKLVEEGRRSM